ncbi:MAG: IS21 family transposase [Epsilonproteobacteria bacterium]|nr:IS21 family transposase [Campylobacterota bacterium]
MKKINEVLRLHLKLELSLRKSCKALQISIGSASNYVGRFKELSIDIDDFLSMDEIEQERLFYPPVGVIKPQTLKVMPDYLYIHHELKQKKKTKVTLALIYDEYKDTNPNNHYGPTQFREYYTRFANTINPSMKMVHTAGEKVFVDYSGLTIPIVNQKTGEITNAQIFVAVLGASGYTFVHATYSQKQRDFILSHTLAYDFFGGTPLIVVPDNLKSAVIKNNKDGIVINESYAALARHYNMAVEPTRPYKPKDKAKAELGVKGIQRWILARLRHQTFFSVDQLNDAISLLLDLYNNKIVKKFQKSRTQMFEELDRPFLQPLPKERFVYREFKEATVTNSYHIFLEGCEYSVPFKYMGFRVFVAYSSQTVAIYYKGLQIALHPKLHFAGAISTLDEHMPKNHEYAKERNNPGRYLNWAKDIGVCTLEWVKKEFERVSHPPTAYQKLNAVLGKAKIYGKAELELTLEYALTKSISSTASIESILSKKLYLQKPINNTTTAVSVELFNTHDNLRGNIYN